MKKKIKDSLSKDTTNKNVNRESKDRLKKKHSEADAKEVMFNPNSLPGIKSRVETYWPPRVLWGRQYIIENS